MGPGFGRAVDGAVCTGIVLLAVAVAIVSSVVTGLTHWLVTPTEESRSRDAERQAIVERLTPRDREILGVR